MSKELIIQTSENGADIALLEDRRLVELHHDSVEEEYLVGDIYLGRVRKVIPSLNAVFVDIGHERDSFLHYHDLGPNIRSMLRFVELVRKGKYNDSRLQNFRYEPEIVKTGKIDEVFTLNQQVVVQIVKEPISTKGLRLSSQISLSGRYLILIPFNDSVSLSKKISTKTERDRLRKTIGGLRPKNFGIIVRTNAQSAGVEELEQDLNKLLADWDSLVQAISQGGNKLYSELDRTASLLRDLVNSSFSRITVDSPRLYKQVRGYLAAVAPGQEDIVRQYNLRGDKSLFESMDVDRQIRSLFNKIVNLGGGAYLIIEHTEAMHVIDVNSGSKRGKKEAGQEDNALRTNMEAASEIARQLRLRDMGGIVVIDFIDMRNTGHRKQLFEHMTELMKSDRAKHTILPLSKFGIMQITRQRARQELVKDNSETCPVCNGTGKVATNVLVTEDIKHKVEGLLAESRKNVVLHVHPYIHAYFTRGIISERMRWFMKFRRWVKIEPHENYSVNQYDIEQAGAETIEG